MSLASRTVFLEEYRKLCEKHKCYLDTGFRQPFYIMEFQYPVDHSFENTLKKLEEDLG